MGRAERRWRRRMRRRERREEGVELNLEPEGSEPLAGMEWGEGDQLEPRRACEGNSAERWEAAQLGTVDQVALLFQVHRKTVERWRRKGGLPCVRPGGVIRYDLEAVLGWASARKDGAGNAGAVEEVVEAGAVEREGGVERTGTRGGDGDGLR
jgi:excisionase family DNA binding protein